MYIFKMTLSFCLILVNEFITLFMLDVPDGVAVGELCYPMVGDAVAVEGVEEGGGLVVV